MSEFFAEILKALRPDSSLPTKDYVIRIIINFLLAIIVAILFYLTVENTILADKMGIAKVSKNLPVLSHVDLLRDFQTTRQVVKQFSDTYQEIKSSFVILLVDETGNVITKPSQISTANTLIWTVVTFKGGEDSLYILDENIRKFNKEILKVLVNGGCTSSKIIGTHLEKYRAVTEMQTTHYVVCPIISKKKVMLGYMLSFLSLPPLPINTKKVKSTENIILLWAFEDRLLRITKFIEFYFDGFENQYKIFYR
jgi:hypothetical protein